MTLPWKLPWGMTGGDLGAALVDVALVAFVVYKTFALLRGTRAVQVAFGFAAVGAGLVIARMLELETLSWLLDHFLNYSVILIVVVFQADIRRGLARLGRRFFGGGRLYEEQHFLEEVVRAAADLAEQKIGALIVLEREADCADFVQGGTPLDAPVTRDMLVCLFSPSPLNPMHDGAVLVRALRIRLAGAILPLSHARMESNLGTRHRAALGLAEDTDAVIVVCSEERATLGIAVAGRLETDLTVEGLRAALNRAFGRTMDSDVRDSHLGTDGGRGVTGPPV